MEKTKQHVKPQMKLADEFLDLRTMKTNVILEQLEETIKLREQPIEIHAKKKLLF